jgi:hypothetical protein
MWVLQGVSLSPRNECEGQFDASQPASPPVTDDPRMQRYGRKPPFAGNSSGKARSDALRRTSLAHVDMHNG